MQALSEAELKLVNRFLKLRSAYIGTMVFVAVFAFVLLAIVFSRLIPAHLLPLKRFPDVEVFVRSGLISLARMNVFWVVLMECILLGNLIAHVQISRILRKLTQK